MATSLTTPALSFAKRLDYSKKNQFSKVIEIVTPVKNYYYVDRFVLWDTFIKKLKLTPS